MITIRSFFHWLFIGIGILVFSPNTFAAAFGVSPPWIQNNTLLPDSHYVYSVDLSTNDPSRDMKVVTALSGDPEIMEWVHVVNSENLIMPKGEKHIPLNVDVKTSINAKPGDYKGAIKVTLVPKDIDSAGVSILLGATIAIHLTVIDHPVTDFWIQSVNIKPFHTGEPLPVNFSVKNLGNVPLDTLQAKLQVFSRNHTLVTETTGYKLLKPVLPQTFDQTSMVVEVKPLPAGDYTVQITVLKDSKSVYSNTLAMTVLNAEDSTLKASAIESINSTLSIQPNIKTQAVVYYQWENLIYLFFVLAVIGIGSGFFLYRKMKRKN